MALTSAPGHDSNAQADRSRRCCATGLLAFAAQEGQRQFQPFNFAALCVGIVRSQRERLQHSQRHRLATVLRRVGDCDRLRGDFLVGKLRVVSTDDEIVKQDLHDLADGEQTDLVIGQPLRARPPSVSARCSAARYVSRKVASRASDACRCAGESARDASRS
jgi:hypothetical protein